MSEYPFSCLLCGTPLQHLADNKGNRVGSIEDAVEAHNATCHKTDEDIEP